MRSLIFLPGLSRALSRFRMGEGGNVAITFSLALPALAMFIGVGVDYSVAIQTKTRAQAALDSGMLSLARQGAPTSASLNKLLTSELAGQHVTLTSATTSTTTNSAGNTIYVGDALLNITPAFLSVAGVQSLPLHAHTEVVTPMRIMTVTFQPTVAQGMYSKDMFFFTRDAQGNITSQPTVMTYRYTRSTGTSVSTPPILGQTMTYTVPPYSTFGVGMVVYQDYTNYSGALINPVSMYSDVNPAAFVHQTGVCSAPGGAQYNMEDGGNADFMDFVYNMTCTMGVDTNKTVYLGK